MSGFGNGAAWKILPFLDAVEDITAGKTKIKADEYLDAGDIPIVDQGQNLYGGYTNDRNAIADVGLPAIVFGDHTRIFKFIETPFALGADGAKILSPKASFDKKFLYYYLSQLPLESAGYSRHFKFLKEKSVPLPPLETQKHIARVLEQADQLRKHAQQMETELNQLAQSLFLEMFGDPKANERNLPISPLEQLIDTNRPITYGILKPGPDIADGVPYIRVVDMKKFKLELNAIRRTTTEISNQYKRSTLSKGDVLLSIRGHVGRLCTAGEECEGFNITQDTARLSPRKGVLGSKYLMHYLGSDHLQALMATQTKGAAVKGINLTDVKKLPILLPSYDAQIRFEEAVTKIEEQSERAATLRNYQAQVFDSLMQRAFKGELPAKAA